MAGRRHSAGFTLPGGAPIPANLDPDDSLRAADGQRGKPTRAAAGALPASYAAVGPQSNSSFIGNTLAAGANITGINMFAPNYQTPRSVQMNFGFEHQFGKGVVWNADYIRNVGTHTLLAIDVNHVGDVRFFNKAAAQNAIAALMLHCGCDA